MIENKHINCNPRAVHSTVNFLVDSGFELYPAIDNYIKGTLRYVNKNREVYLFQIFFKKDDENYYCKVVDIIL